MPRAKPHTKPYADVEPEDMPTFDDYFKEARELSRLVRKSLTVKGSVSRGEIKRALVRFERIDQATLKP